ncbi:NAD-dependent epimerase/dehydratase family protein [Azospirillum endophyticum]
MRIVVTGAAGGVATLLRPHLRERYDTVRLTDRTPATGLAANERFTPSQLSDLETLLPVLDGADAVLHLGGNPYEADWAEIDASNITGTANLFEAARRTGVRRVVFASSCQVAGFYPRRRRIGTEAPVRPSSLYGVSKAAGEGLASLYADKHDLKILSVRIGRCQAVPSDLRHLSVWVSPEDLFQLVTIGFEHPDITHDIVWGISDNAQAWWDNRRAFELGYRPRSRAEDHAAAAAEGQKNKTPDRVADFFQGASLTALGNTGSLLERLS